MNFKLIPTQGRSESKTLDRQRQDAIRDYTERVNGRLRDAIKVLDGLPRQAIERARAGFWEVHITTTCAYTNADAQIVFTYWGGFEVPAGDAAYEFGEMCRLLCIPSDARSLRDWRPNL